VPRGRSRNADKKILQAIKLLKNPTWTELLNQINIGKDKNLIAESTFVENINRLVVEGRIKKTEVIVNGEKQSRYILGYTEVKNSPYGDLLSKDDWVINAGGAIANIKDREEAKKLFTKYLDVLYHISAKRLFYFFIMLSQTIEGKKTIDLVKNGENEAAADVAWQMWKKYSINVTKVIMEPLMGIFANADIAFDDQNLSILQTFLDEKIVTTFNYAENVDFLKDLGIF
jgi:hypothetical protein